MVVWEMAAICPGLNVLSHGFLVTHEYVSKLGQYWFR